MTDPLCPISNHGSLVTLLKFQMASKLRLLISSGSKKEEPRYPCLSEAKAPHSQRMWAEVSSLTPHLLHNGLSSSPGRWRCLFRVLCPVRRPVATLDWVLLKVRNLALVPRLGPEINCRACLWVSPRPRLFCMSHLETPRAGSGPRNLRTELPLASSSGISLPPTPSMSGDPI